MRGFVAVAPIANNNFCDSNLLDIVTSQPTFNSRAARSIPSNLFESAQRPCSGRCAVGIVSPRRCASNGRSGHAGCRAPKALKSASSKTFLRIDKRLLCQSAGLQQISAPRSAATFRQHRGAPNRNVSAQLNESNVVDTMANLSTVFQASAQLGMAVRDIAACVGCIRLTYPCREDWLAKIRNASNLGLGCLFDASRLNWADDRLSH